MIIFKTTRADFSLVAAGLAGLFWNRSGGKTHTSTAAPPYLRDFLFRNLGAHSGYMFFRFLWKSYVFFFGCWLCAPAAHWLSFLVVWAAAACRALLRCTGFPFWSFGLLRLAGRAYVQQKDFPSIWAIDLAERYPEYNIRLPRVSEPLILPFPWLHTTDRSLKYLSH